MKNIDCSVSLVEPLHSNGNTEVQVSDPHEWLMPYVWFSVWIMKRWQSTCYQLLKSYSSIFLVVLEVKQKASCTDQCSTIELYLQNFLLRQSLTKLSIMCSYPPAWVSLSIWDYRRPLLCMSKTYRYINRDNWLGDFQQRTFFTLHVICRSQILQ